MTRRAATADPNPTQKSWLPMAAIALGQAQLSWNTNALPVSVGAIAGEFGASSAVVVTAIVAFSLAAAGFTMLGARLGQRIGALRMFRAATGLFLAATVATTFSPGPAALIAAQAVAGLAAAAIIPSLVVLTAHHYRGSQQVTALGLLGAVQAVATVAAFLVAGVVGTYLGWRYSFGLLAPMSVAALLLSRHLAPLEPVRSVRIDRLGVLLAAGSVALISLGFNFVDDWGLLLATPRAPMDLLGLSPAPVMIVCGIVGVQTFIAWTQQRQSTGRTPLLAPTVIESTQDRAAVVSMLAITMLGRAVIFLVPLYIQIVQGRTSFYTAVAMIPYQVAVLVAALLAAKLYARWTPRRIARGAIAVVTVGTLLLALTVRNDWSNGAVVLGLLLIGLGHGTLSTLLFNVLVSSSPPALAADVGALRGTVSQLAAAVGTAVTGALVAGVLAANVERALLDHPRLPPALISQVDLEDVRFVSNDRLREVMARTTATPEELEAALQVNDDARLGALKVTFLMLTALGLLALVPAGRLPAYRPEEVPA
jgi:MFS family permease